MNRITCGGWMLGLLVGLLGSPSARAAAAGRPFILDMVHHNCGDKRYDTAYEDPAVIRKMGYTGKVYYLFDSPTLATTWESVDPEILPKGSKEREWVEEKAARIRAQQEACRTAGLSVYAMADMVLLPKRLVEKHGIQATFGDVGHPGTQALLRAQMAEVFDQFPLTDGLVVRIGETYLHDAPHHAGSIRDKHSPEKTIVPLMNLLREEICVKRNKTLIFRTWMSFDENPGAYQKISDAVEPHPNLLIAIKHCEGDFHRATRFSRSIGQGRHRQLMEVQCAREYEGKGAHPNYIAHGVIEGFEEHARMPDDRIRSIRGLAERRPELFAGFWTWTRGGGWDGPYIRNELWCDLNAWVLAQWALDTSQSEEAVFRRYARDRLGLKDDDIEAFRRLCLLSADAVVRGRNSTHGDMNPWWTRDQGIGWPQVTGDRERNLRQKDEAVALWREIVELATAIDWPDEKTRDHAIGSSYYGLRLYEIYRSLVYLEDAARRQDNEAIRTWIEAYDAAWAAYGELTNQHPEAASLYTREYRRHIQDHADGRVELLRRSL